MRIGAMPLAGIILSVKFSAIHSAPRRGRDPISTKTNLSNILASSRRLLVGERESVRQSRLPSLPFDGLLPKWDSSTETYRHISKGPGKYMLLPLNNNRRALITLSTPLFAVFRMFHAEVLANAIFSKVDSSTP